MTDADLQRCTELAQKHRHDNPPPPWLTSVRQWILSSPVLMPLVLWELVRIERQGSRYLLTWPGYGATRAAWAELRENDKEATEVAP